MLGFDMLDIYLNYTQWEEGKRHSTVHEKLLRTKIPHFEPTSLHARDLSRPREVIIYGIDHKAFDLLLRWVYTGEANPSDPHLNSIASMQFYKLAAKYKLVDLMDQIVDTYIDNFGSYIPVVLFDLYSRLVEDAPEPVMFRKFSVYALRYMLHSMPQDKNRLAFQQCDAEFFSSIGRQFSYHPKLLMEYVESVGELAPGEKALDPKKMPRCTFHEHAPDAPCRHKT